MQHSPRYRLIYRPRIPLWAWAVAAGLWLAIGIAIAHAQASPIPGPPSYVTTQYLYKHITTDATTTVKSSSGVLHTICISTPAATETITAYDNTSATAPVIAIITSYASLPGCYTYDIVFNTGLTIVSATAAGDITVAYQ